MANGLYARVASRGFPTSVDVGTTGEGALYNSGNPDLMHQQQTAVPGFTPAQTMKGFAPEPLPPVSVYISDDDYGLVGDRADPDQTPGYGPGAFRTHNAPMAGPNLNAPTPWATPQQLGEIAGSLEEVRGIHSQRFARSRGYVQSAEVTVQVGQQTAGEIGETLSDNGSGGQMRGMAGIDSVQGFGGGGSGPGGINGRYPNEKHYLTTAEGSVLNATVDPSERPLTVPQLGQTFKLTGPDFGPGPWQSGFETYGNYHPPTDYGVQSESPLPTLAEPLTEGPVG